MAAVKVSVEVAQGNVFNIRAVRRPRIQQVAPEAVGKSGVLLPLSPAAQISENVKKREGFEVARWPGVQR